MAFDVSMEQSLKFSVFSFQCGPPNGLAARVPAGWLPAMVLFFETTCLR
jgi:hypothetical protein